MTHFDTGAYYSAVVIIKTKFLFYIDITLLPISIAHSFIAMDRRLEERPVTCIAMYSYKHTLECVDYNKSCSYYTGSRYNYRCRNDDE